MTDQEIAALQTYMDDMKDLTSDIIHKVNEMVERHNDLAKRVDGLKQEGYSGGKRYSDYT